RNPPNETRPRGAHPQPCFAGRRSYLPSIPIRPGSRWSGRPDLSPPCRSPVRRDANSHPSGEWPGWQGPSPDRQKFLKTTVTAPPPQLTQNTAPLSSFVPAPPSTVPLRVEPPSEPAPSVKENVSSPSPSCTLTSQKASAEAVKLTLSLPEPVSMVRLTN